MSQAIEQIEISIEESKKLIEFGDAIRRLDNNPDFVKVILEGYFKEEASRIVLLKGDYGMQAQEHQEFLDKMVIAIGGLKQFLLSKLRMAEAAAQALEADRETHAELLREDIQGDD